MDSPKAKSVAALLDEGMALHRQGRLDRALPLYREAHEREPANAQALNLLGVVALESGQAKVAVELLAGAARQAPDDAAYRNNLGNALKTAGRRIDALAAYRGAVALAPAKPELLTNLGACLSDVGAVGHASWLHRSLDVAPGYADTWFALGQATLRNDAELAIRPFRVATALDPGLAASFSALGNAYHDLEAMEAAVRHYRRAVAANPRDQDAYSNLLFGLCFLPDTGDAGFYRANRAWARWIESGAQPPTPDNDPDPDRPLNVGYVSPDFRAHQFLMQVRPLWQHHDRRRFRLVGYADVGKPDAETRRLAAEADVWRDIHGMSRDEFRAAVMEEKIDVLVCLTSYLATHRRWFATRLAPVQVVAINQIGTTGLSTMDGRLTDRWLDPPGTEAWSSETPIRLETGFACFRPSETAPAVSTLPYDINGFVTFGSFNNLAKITDHTLALWASLLRELPNAQLTVKALTLSRPDAEARLRRRTEAHGIPFSRLRLVGAIHDPSANLAALGAADIALDPIPFTGGLSTADVLWMGVPVVSLAGASFVGRVGASILARAGLTELIASTPEDYIRIAKELATDPVRLRSLRAGLRDRLSHSSLTDGMRFASEVERTYRGLWRAWCDRQRPAPG
jgi:predicted O-linked N-acetylglucosamine transferase (SPINDLY family)